MGALPIPQRREGPSRRRCSRIGTTARTRRQGSQTPDSTAPGNRPRSAIHGGEASLSAIERYSKKNPCPICGGGTDDPRGQGARCFGFLGSDRLFSHCTREEL